LVIEKSVNLLWTTLKTNAQGTLISPQYSYKTLVIEKSVNLLWTTLKTNAQGTLITAMHNFLIPSVTDGLIQYLPNRFLVEEGKTKTHFVGIYSNYKRLTLFFAYFRRKQRAGF